MISQRLYRFMCATDLSGKIRYITNHQPINNNKYKHDIGHFKVEPPDIHL